MGDEFSDIDVHVCDLVCLIKRTDSFYSLIIE